MVSNSKLKAWPVLRAYAHAHARARVCKCVHTGIVAPHTLKVFELEEAPNDLPIAARVGHPPEHAFKKTFHITNRCVYGEVEKWMMARRERNEEVERWRGVNQRGKVSESE